MNTNRGATTACEPSAVRTHEFDHALIEGADAQHERWMREALAESRRALPDCKPNPPVGCVVVSAGRIVARGYTNGPGQPHAEAMALQHLHHVPSGASVYVTLEPCSFHGRTPSCAKALVAARVSAVHVAVVDPDPRNQGRGIQLLRDAGIPVEVGCLRHEVAAFIGAHLITA